MSGVGLAIETRGLADLNRRLDRLYLSGGEMRRLLGDIGALVESQTRRRIEEEKTSPEGKEWPELDEKYAARKARVSSGGILEFAGDLLDSITHEVDGDAVEVGTNLIYGATQNEGDEDRNIEAREYLGISDENRDDTYDLTEDFIRGLFE